MKIDYANRIFGLDVMRAVAILFVVCSHALWVFPNEQGSFHSLLRFSGVMGVEIFFVLSGFLIGRLLYRIFVSDSFQVKQLGYFLTRRWFRTLPNYYLILVINILIVIYLGRELPDTLGLYPFFLQNAVSGMDIFFTESWSLPIEEFAYIIGPFLLYALVTLNPKTSRKKTFLIVTLFIIVFYLLSKVFYQLHHGATTLEFWNTHLKAVVLYRIDAIYYGVLAAYLSQVFSKHWERYKGMMWFLSLVFFVGVHLMISWFSLSSETAPWFLNVFYLPLCSFCIALSLPVFATWKKAPRAILRPITFISLISYSMYLLHYSIILQLMRYFIPLEVATVAYKLVFSVGYVSLTIGLSYLLYRFYEKPMMDIRDRPFIKNRFRKG